MSSQQEHINDAIEEGSIRVWAAVTDEQADVLTPGALRFVAALAREFEATRLELLRKREIRQREIEDGILSWPKRDRSGWQSGPSRRFPTI